MSNEDAELIKAGTQALIEGGMKPFSDLIRTVLGPAAEEAGAMFQEHVRSYRIQRQIRLWAQTQKALEALGVKPRQVPLRLLAPIIENASVEDDDDLQDIWANLLANAAGSEGVAEVHPSFPGILKDFTPQDAKFLDSLYGSALQMGKGEHRKSPANEVVFDLGVARAVYARIGDKKNAKLSMDLFERHGLIRTKYGLTKYSNEIGSAYSFTSFGIAFIEACRASKPPIKSSSE